MPNVSRSTKIGSEDPGQTPRGSSRLLTVRQGWSPSRSGRGGSYERTGEMLKGRRKAPDEGERDWKITTKRMNWTENDERRRVVDHVLERDVFGKAGGHSGRIGA